MTAQPHALGLGAHDVELANVASPITAETGPSNSTANVPEYDYLDGDRAAGVYRPRSTESSEPPPAYVLKPPPYRFKDPAPAKPRPPWKQWVVDHRKWLLVGTVLLVPAIVVATIYGIMKARVQGLVNNMQFEGGNKTSLELEVDYYQSTFDWQDILWNNDSQYKSLDFDDFGSLTITLEGADKALAELEDISGPYFESRSYYYVRGSTSYSLYRAPLGNDNATAEMIRRLITEEEVGAWVEGRTKVKISENLPKYSVHFKKKIKFQGFGGITGFDIFNPRMWNLSDPKQIEYDGAARHFNFLGNARNSLMGRINGSTTIASDSYSWSKSFALTVDIYENGTETRLGQGNLTSFALPDPDGYAALTAMIDVDFAEIEQMSKAYDDGMMPWVLRPTGAFMPTKLSRGYSTVERGEDMPWLFEAFRGLEIPMVVNVPEGMEWLACGYGYYDDTGTCIPFTRNYKD